MLHHRHELLRVCSVVNAKTREAYYSGWGHSNCHRRGRREGSIVLNLVASSQAEQCRCALTLALSGRSVNSDIGHSRPLGSERTKPAGTPFPTEHSPWHANHPWLMGSPLRPPWQLTSPHFFTTRIVYKSIGGWFWFCIALP